MIDDNEVTIYLNDLEQFIISQLINNGFTGKELSIKKFEKTNKYSLSIGLEDSIFNANADKFATIDLTKKAGPRLLIKSDLIRLISNDSVIETDNNKYKAIDFNTFPELIETAKEAALAELEVYSPALEFGCCSKYVQCSEAKRCLHEYKLYAKGCQYRKSLENGLIFYGDNKNI